MALLGYTNAVDAAGSVLGASAEAVGFGVGLLRVPLGASSVAWQTPAGTRDAFLTISASAAINWRIAALCRTNLSATARIRVRVGALATVISAPIYDSGLISADVVMGIRQALHVMPNEVNATTMSIYVDDFNNPDPYLNVPLVYAGAATEFAIAPGSETGREIRSDDTTTRGGTIITQPLSNARGWKVEAAFIRDEETAWLDNLEAQAGARRNILFVPRSPYARGSSEAILGILTPGRLGFLGQTSEYRTWSGTIMERL